MKQDERTPDAYLIEAPQGNWLQFTVEVAEADKPLVRVKPLYAYTSTEALRSALANLCDEIDHHIDAAPADRKPVFRGIANARAALSGSPTPSPDTFDLEAFLADELEPGELRPCPFCGGEAHAHEIEGDEDDENFGGSVISCASCGCSSAVHFDRRENLYSNWNRRQLEKTNEAIKIANETVVGLAAEIHKLRDALTLILPMAKGYAHAHPVGDNYGKCLAAEEALSGGATISIKEIVRSGSPAPSTEGLREWQPIETAPRDGTKVLAWAEAFREPYVIYWGRSNPMNGAAWLGGHCHVDHIDQPTHWMPLPPAPDAARTALAGVTADNGGI